MGSCTGWVIPGSNKGHTRVNGSNMGHTGHKVEDRTRVAWVIRVTDHKVTLSLATS